MVTYRHSSYTNGFLGLCIRLACVLASTIDLLRSGWSGVRMATPTGNEKKCGRCLWFLVIRCFEYRYIYLVSFSGSMSLATCPSCFSLNRCSAFTHYEMDYFTTLRPKYDGSLKNHTQYSFNYRIAA